MAIAVRRLLMRKEALWHDEMKFVFGSRHRHIEQTAFLLESLPSCRYRDLTGCSRRRR